MSIVNLISDRLNSSIENEGSASFVLSGGSSPISIYEELSNISIYLYGHYQSHLLFQFVPISSHEVDAGGPSREIERPRNLFRNGCVLTYSTTPPLFRISDDQRRYRRTGIPILHILRDDCSSPTCTLDNAG